MTALGDMMKKWFILVALLIFVAIWQLFALYDNVTNKWEQMVEEALHLAQKTASLETVANANFYHGTSAYYVIAGIDKTGEDIIVFVPEDLNREQIIVKKAKEGISEQEVKEQIIANRAPLSIKSIRLGVENNKPLWEVTYIDEQQRYTYYYLDFENGEFLKRYSLNMKDMREEL